MMLLALLALLALLTLLTPLVLLLLSVLALVTELYLEVGSSLVIVTLPARSHEAIEPCPRSGVQRDAVPMREGLGLLARELARFVSR